MIEGQWLGEDKGTSDGTVWLELDKFGDQARGYAMRLEHDGAVPSTYLELSLDNNFSTKSFTAPIHPLDPETGSLLTREQTETRFPDGLFGQNAQVQISFATENRMRVRWSSDVGANGDVFLDKQFVPATSQIQPEASVSTWEDFKRAAFDQVDQNLLFRGQQTAWPLQATFFRTRRSDLYRFVRHDLNELNRRFTSILPTNFDRTDPIENMSLLAMAQHHGFPTPTLDWSKSPFIASYFAVRPLLNEHRTTSGKIRVFCLDIDTIQSCIGETSALSLTRPYLMAIYALPRANPRLLPQQGVLTSTNLRDIEGFLHFLERRYGRRLIWAYDIEINNARQVMRELRTMGIVSSALFPGIDGICEDLQSENFWEID